jgi:hypothetical protein
MISDSSQAERVPVSRVQRFLPFLSYSLMGLGGAVAGYYAIRVVAAFGDTENTGIGQIAEWLAGGISSVTIGLALAAVVGIGAIIVTAAMIFAQKRTTAPSALMVLLMAILGMLAPILAWPVIMELLTAPMDPKMDPAQLASSSRTYGIAAILLGTLTLVAGFVLSFLPMRSSPGKKFGALVVMIVVEVLIAGAFIYLTMQARAITRMALGY